MLNDGCIQNISVGIGPIAEIPLTPFFQFAHIGIDEISCVCHALSEFWVHAFTTGAIHKPRQQGFIAPGFSVPFGFVPIQ